MSEERVSFSELTALNEKEGKTQSVTSAMSNTQMYVHLCAACI